MIRRPKLSRKRGERGGILVGAFYALFFGKKSIRSAWGGSRSEKAKSEIRQWCVRFKSPLVDGEPAVIVGGLESFDFDCIKREKNEGEGGR